MAHNTDAYNVPLLASQVDEISKNRTGIVSGSVPVTANMHQITVKVISVDIWEGQLSWHFMLPEEIWFL